MVFNKIISMPKNAILSWYQGSLFVGRPAPEYLKMFNLSLDYLRGLDGPVLDLCAGSNELVSYLSKAGVKGVAADFRYLRDGASRRALHARELYETALQSIDSVNLKKTYPKEFQNITESLEQFERHYTETPEAYRYVDAREKLPFSDNEFALSVNGNNLFLRIKTFRLPDISHIMSELIRVSRKEIRIFPIDGDRDPNGLEDMMMQDLRDSGLIVDIEPPGYDRASSKKQAILCIKKPEGYQMTSLRFEQASQVTADSYFGPISLFGRPLIEYEGLFGIRVDELKSKGVTTICDLGAGQSSFCSEASGKGFEVVAVDTKYARDPKMAAFRKEQEAFQKGICERQLKTPPSGKYGESIQRIAPGRLQSTTEFNRDFEANPRRYIEGDICSKEGLPIAENSQDLVLCGNSLFLHCYANYFTYPDLQQALLNMIQITKPGGELRIAPITIGGAHDNRYATELQDWLASDAFVYNVKVSFIPCPVQYQSGTTPDDKVLVISKMS